MNTHIELKKLMLLAAGLFFATALAAQPGTGSKTAATFQRIKAISKYQVEGTAVQTDSFRFRYKGDAGCWFNPIRILNPGAGFSYEYVPVYDWNLERLSPTGFLDVAFDTMWHYKIDSVYGATQHQYRTITRQAGQIQRYDVLGYGQDYLFTRTEQKLNAAGMPEAIYSIYFINNANRWDTTSIRYLKYSNDGRLAEDSIYYIAYSSWGPGPTWTVKSRYSYENNGRLKRLELWRWLDNEWKEANGNTYHYDAGGKLVHIINGFFRGTSQVVDTAGQTVLAYNGNIATWRHRDYGRPGNWFRSYSHSIILDADRKTIAINQQFVLSGAESRYDSTFFHYSNSAFPDAAVNYTRYNHTPDADHDSVRYWYEQYESTDVPEARPQAALVDVFPNPASGTFHLRWREIPNLTNLTVQLYDMAGRRVCNLAVTASYPSQKIQLADVPAGNYLLRIAAGGEHILQQKLSIR